ncbi:MAG: lipid-transfer protein [Chloroflexi bacterium]|mgnify:CR=1 FL=1|nr:lipid-transfer protein [Chloroflexota bacterium]|tara:strand:+ start:2168 stop:3361 length:1194 start_codon:yes stop_codon:yes gene_type:complete
MANLECLLALFNINDYDASMDDKSKVAIVGIGETEYSRESGRSELVLTLEAIMAALDDAGIEPHEIDGLMRWSVDTSNEALVAENLGIKSLNWFGDISQAGNVGAALVASACAAIRSNLAEIIVIYRGVNGRSGRRYGSGVVTGRQGQGLGAFSEPFGLLTPQHGLAMMTQRRMYETGVTSRHFGMVSVTERFHANRNPRATFFDRSLTIEDHQNSRFVVEPFRLFDCCLETDGGGAIILTSLDRAKSLRKPPAVVRATAQHAYASSRDYTDTAAKFIAPLLWSRAQITPSEVSVAQIYDHFSPFVIFALEDYGFVERGEGGDFVESGQISWDGGALPVNTSGGHLSEAYMQGMNQLLEGVRQIRGTSTSQVQDVNFSFVDTGIGTGAVVLEPDIYG